MKLKFHTTALHRAAFYMNMAATGAFVALALALMKSGTAHDIGVMAGHAWQHVSHFLTEVASAEVGAAVLFRVFGTVE